MISLENGQEIPSTIWNHRQGQQSQNFPFFNPIFLTNDLEKTYQKHLYFLFEPKIIENLLSFVIKYYIQTSI